MKKELQEQLVAKHPIIFRDYGGDIRETCMGWGIDCGDGWFNLIDELCFRIENVFIGAGFNTIADQVKEKFGGLRFYCHYEDDEDNKQMGIRILTDAIERYIDKAERDSYTICEKCGEEGKFREGKNCWMRTLCDVCEEEYKNDKNWVNLK